METHPKSSRIHPAATPGQIQAVRTLIVPAAPTRGLVFEDFAELIRVDYKKNARRAPDRLERSLAHLHGFFAGMSVATIKPGVIATYVGQRLRTAANATINRELAALHRMFELGRQLELVSAIPFVQRLTERNIREGFFEEAEFLRVLAGIRSPDLANLLRTAYLTGWRIKSELQPLQWPQVDLVGDWLRLEPGHSKTDDGRNFPLFADLRAIFVEQRTRTDACEQALGVSIPWVFHRRGKRIRDFREAWRRACRQAGVPQRIPHDFRRTAVRNLTRAGVDRATAKKLVGHRTDSIYERYAIADEGLLKEAGGKLAALHATPVRGAAPGPTIGVGPGGILPAGGPGPALVGDARGRQDPAALRPLEADALHAVAAAYAALVTADTPVTLELLAAMHRDWLGGLYPWAGQYRTMPLVRDGRTYPAPHLLPARMRGFEAAILRPATPVAGTDRAAMVRALAAMQAAFLAIRPFPRGNGRLIRLASGLLARAAGWSLPDYGLDDPERRAAYEAAVRAATAGHPAALERLIREAMRHGRR